jgi:Skp family chaperone for outer membrane proteins
MQRPTGVQIGDRFVSFDCTVTEAQQRVIDAQLEAEKDRFLGRLKTMLRELAAEQEKLF